MFFTKNIDRQFIEHFFDIMDEQILNSSDDFPHENNKIEFNDFDLNDIETGLTSKKRKSPVSSIEPNKSSYIWFVSEKVQAYRASLKDPSELKVLEVMKIIADLWKTLPASERLRYEEIAIQDKQRYHDEMRSLNASNRCKKSRKAQDAPKRSMSAFLIYAQKMRSLIRMENPELKNTEISTILSHNWKNLSQEKKQVYQDLEVIEREKYHQSMKAYRQNLVFENSIQKNNQQSYFFPSNTNTYSPMYNGYPPNVPYSSSCYNFDLKGIQGDSGHLSTYQSINPDFDSDDIMKDFPLYMLCDQYEGDDHSFTSFSSSGSSNFSQNLQPSEEDASSDVNLIALNIVEAVRKAGIYP